jgi:hypothetical protein
MTSLIRLCPECYTSLQEYEPDALSLWLVICQFYVTRGYPAHVDTLRIACCQGGDQSTLKIFKRVMANLEKLRYIVTHETNAETLVAPRGCRAKTSLTYFCPQDHFKRYN